MTRTRIQAIALDFGTISTDCEDHVIGQKGVAQCPSAQVLFAGNSIPNDVAGPMRAGMQACLVRPGGLRAGEQLPDGALLIGHVRELPALLAAP